jgi:hypothetical protein
MARHRRIITTYNVLVMCIEGAGLHYWYKMDKDFPGLSTFVFGCNIGELNRVFDWPTEMGGILGAMLVNQTRYLSGPLK